MSEFSNKALKLLGFFLLFLTILFMVTSSILIKKITTDEDYPYPFQFSYYNYTFLVILIPVFFIKRKIIKYYHKKEEESKRQAYKAKNLKDNKSKNTILPYESKDSKENKINFIENSTSNQEISTCNIEYDEYEKSSSDLNRIANTENITLLIESLDSNNKFEYYENFNGFVIILMLLWYLGNSFYNVSLMTTSISSANTLSNSSILFILFIRLVFFKDSCSFYKIFGLIIILLALGGIFWIDSGSQSSDNNSSILGDIFSVVGAIFYSVFAVYLKELSNKYRYNFDLIEVFGYIGFYLIFMIPILILILHLSSIERFQLPTTQQLIFIVINAIIGTVICDLLQNFSNILLSPHVVSFGLTFTIPVSNFWDMLYGVKKFDYRYIIISLLILIAFFIIGYEEYTIEEKTKLKEKKKKAEIYEETDVNKDNEETTK